MRIKQTTSIILASAVLAQLGAWTMIFTSASMPEFSNLAFQSCEWLENGRVTSPTTSPPTSPSTERATRPRQPDESAGGGSTTDIGDCWKVYSGYPIDCPRRDPLRWSWLGRFNRPVGLQRVVVKGALLDSDRGAERLLPAGLTAIARPWDAAKPERDCRLEQLGGSLAIFDCSGAGAAAAVGAVLVGVRRADGGLAETTPEPRTSSESPSEAPMPICGIRIYDVHTRSLALTSCRQSTTSGSSAPGQSRRATSCQSPQISSQSEWHGYFGRSVQIGRVILEACPSSASPNESFPSTTPESEESVCENISVSAGRHPCDSVADIDDNAAATFDCGGTRAGRLTVRSGPQQPPSNQASRPLFELCAVVAYGIERSGRLLSYSRVGR